METNKRGVGDLARGSIKVMEFAVALQGLAVDHIRDTFAATSMLDFEAGVSQGEFNKALLEADSNGQRDQFEAYLAEQLAGSWVAFQEMQAAAAAAEGAQ